MSCLRVVTVPEVRARVSQLRLRGDRIGFIPTMGALHEGHLSLMRAAAAVSDHVIVSIFVNPTQFGEGEDLSRYPRCLDRDGTLCAAVGVGTIFAPDVAGMYSSDASVGVTEGVLSKGMCGGTRPGHFNGVATVVCKLFNIVQPDVAVFGQKDAQQLAVIRRVVRDLDIPVEIISGPIVREADGLAMSSRNAYLSAEEREQALCLSRGLAAVRSGYAAGQYDASGACSLLSDYVGGVSAALEYAVCVDADTLAPVSMLRPGVLVAVAARVGATRLIDNLLL